MQKTFTYPKFEYVTPPELAGAGAAPGHYPVVVVGAGPVGLATAIDLAQQGQPVLLSHLMDLSGATPRPRRPQGGGHGGPGGSFKGGNKRHRGGGNGGGGDNRGNR